MKHKSIKKYVVDSLFNVTYKYKSYPNFIYKDIFHQNKRYIISSNFDGDGVLYRTDKGIKLKRFFD